MSYNSSSGFLKEDVENFIPIREAAKRVSYTTDYVGRLAREGKILAKRSGRNWMVELDSLKLFSLQAKADAIKKQEALKIQRRIEIATAQLVSNSEEIKVLDHTKRHIAVLETTALTICFALALLLIQVSLSSGFGLGDYKRGISLVGQETQSAFALSSLTNFKLPEWLWFVRYEKANTSLTAVEATESEKTANGTESQTRYPSQIDTANDSLLISASAEDMEENPSYLEDTFSDDVLVEFVDSRNGTVTAEFVSGDTEVYPFRLVKEPVKPTID